MYEVTSCCLVGVYNISSSSKHKLLLFTFTFKVVIFTCKRWWMISKAWAIAHSADASPATRAIVAQSVALRWICNHNNNIVSWNLNVVEILCRKNVDCEIFLTAWSNLSLVSAWSINTNTHNSWLLLRIDGWVGCLISSFVVQSSHFPRNKMMIP